MPHIQVSEAQSWLESTKTNLGASLDANMEDNIAAQVLARVSLSYDVSLWVDPTSTPKLVRQVIAMLYASWFYQRQYSEESDALNNYALLLSAQSEAILQGIIDGSIDLPEIPGTGGPIGNDYPAFYPNDKTADSQGNPEGPAFTMGKLW
jgi:hypothetical protein